MEIWWLIELVYIYYYIVLPLNNLYNYIYTDCKNNKVFEYITYYYYYYTVYTIYYIHSLLQEINDYDDDKKYHHRVYAWGWEDVCRSK